MIVYTDETLNIVKYYSGNSIAIQLSIRPIRPTLFNAGLYIAYRFMRFVAYRYAAYRY